MCHPLYVRKCSKTNGGEGRKIKTSISIRTDSFLCLVLKKPLDKAVGDGLNILTEFVDRESSSPTCTFKESSDSLCGAAKFCLIQIIQTFLGWSLHAKYKKMSGRPELSN